MQHRGLQQVTAHASAQTGQSTSWRTSLPSVLPAAVCSSHSPCGTATRSSMPITVSGLTCPHKMDGSAFLGTASVHCDLGLARDGARVLPHRELGGCRVVHVVRNRVLRQ